MKYLHAMVRIRDVEKSLDFSVINLAWLRPGATTLSKDGLP